ncbi:MAG TPA: nucleotidyltransferase family protein [Gemmatimonadaceae bacterium]|nr:nucleotidyltransferase family protein [Gemmatimonadaceae bacterium]
MKAVILARGLGTRMRREDPGAPLTDEQVRAAAAGSKAMMPVGRPFLDFVLSGLADAGVTEICLVVAPDHGAIRHYYDREVRPTRFALHYAVQPRALGTADAVLAARAFAGSDPFLVLNGDNYYPADAYRALIHAGAPALVGFEPGTLVRLGHIEADRVRRYALLRVGADDVLLDIVEKPDPAAAAALGHASLVSMNLWAFPPAIFEACAAVRPSVRGELELPDAVRHAIRVLDVRFRVIPLAAGVLDLAGRADVAVVAERLQDVTAWL